jgi:hypothetical protein
VVANDYITITLGEADSPHVLLTAIESVRAALRDVSKCQGRMSHTVSATDYAALESKFGLPAGQGAGVFTLIDGTLQVLDGTASGYAKELIDRVGLS